MLKINTILKYICYRNDVISGLSEDFLHLPPVAAKVEHPDTFDCDYNLQVRKVIFAAIQQLGFKDSGAFDAGTQDAVYSRVRQLVKEEIKSKKLIAKSKGFSLSSFPAFKNEDLQDAFDLFCFEANQFREKYMCYSLRCAGEDLRLTKELVHAYTGGNNPLDVAALAHFWWQVKRKSLGMPVSNHLMIVLFGPQGCGKSRAIQKIMGPFDEYGYTIEGNLAQITDDRWMPTLAEKFVCFLDEMGHAEKADVSVLKNVISALRVNPRKLGSNKHYDIAQRASFIGASNRPLNELIFDGTGMRRFWQINCAAKMDWSKISTIDYKALFQGIDEDREDGYLAGEILDQFKRAQCGLVNHDDITFFIDDAGHAPGETFDQFFSSAEVYSSFCKWAVANGSKFSPTKHEFLKKFKNKGFQEVIKNHDGKTHRGFWIRKKAMEV